MFYSDQDVRNIASSLKSLEEATAKFDEETLHRMHHHGYLPTGMLDWLLACRAKIKRG